jgi:hypothetical protein
MTQYAQRVDYISPRQELIYSYEVLNHTIEVDTFT